MFNETLSAELAETLVEELNSSSSEAGVGTCQGNFDGKARQGKSCLGKFVARQGKFVASFFGERFTKFFM